MFQVSIHQGEKKINQVPDLSTAASTKKTYLHTFLQNFQTCQIITSNLSQLKSTVTIKKSSKSKILVHMRRGWGLSYDFCELTNVACRRWRFWLRHFKLCLSVVFFVLFTYWRVEFYELSFVFFSSIPVKLALLGNTSPSLVYSASEPKL